MINLCFQRCIPAALLAAVGVAAAAPATAAPAATQGDAAAGLQAMRELNLIVLGDWHATQDVEGKVFADGNGIGSAPVGIGIGNGSQGSTPSGRRTLTIAGNSSIGNLNLGNGPNGGNGNVATNPGVLIGGNSGSINVNAPGANIDVGGNLQANYNVGAGQTFTIGGNF